MPGRQAVAGSRGHAPAQRVRHTGSPLPGPGVGRHQRIPRADGAHRVDARRQRLHQAVPKRAHGAAAAQREHHRLRSQLANPFGRLQIVRAREQRLAQQASGLLLVRRHHRGAGGNALAQRVAIGVQQRFHFLLTRHGDQFSVKRRRHSRRNAAADCQPRRAVQRVAHHPFHARHLRLPKLWTGFVEVDREPVLVGNGEIRADLVLNPHHRDPVPAFAQKPLEAFSRIAAGDEHGQGFAAEGVNHRGDVNAAAPRRLAAGIDVGAILERQTVDTDDPVDGRIDGECNDQAPILPWRSLQAAVSALLRRLFHTASQASP